MNPEEIDIKIKEYTDKINELKKEKNDGRSETGFD